MQQSQEPIKIVVLTPIKNEEWILERFLSVTSQFADHIVVADQHSTDASLDICKRYPKVTVIENPKERYDEAERQLLLLRAARELVPGPKILLALDADEVLAADALQATGWKTILEAPRGTVLCFEKPDLLEDLDQCLRTGAIIPLGYVDDGAEHSPKVMHSRRIPAPEGAHLLELPDVKILHYALTRHHAQAAKMRRYSVVENLLYGGSLRQLIRRRLFYAPDQSYVKSGHVERAPATWFRGWEEKGIDMRTIIDQEYNWQDYDVLKTFQRYGTRRFRFENIWDFNWEACRKHAQTQGIEGIPKRPIQRPSKVILTSLRMVDVLVSKIRILF